MKKIEKIQFQLEAIDEILDKSIIALKHNEDRVLFTAPVGSGKTVIAGMYINKFLKKMKNKGINKYAFIWVSTSKGNLLEQSKNNISNLNREGSIKSLDDIMLEGRIHPNDIVFMNWESIRSDVNIVRKEGEKINFNQVMETSSDVDKILLIDEAHENVGAKQTDEAIKLINPKLTIHITATPKEKKDSYNQIIDIDIERVIEEGIVKKGVVINEGLKDNTQSIILDKAISKRNEIEKELEKYDRKIKRKPLVLIQIANDSKEYVKDNVLEITNAENIRNMLIKKGIDNDKIGIWLAEKENNQNIEEDIRDSDIEFLIFKQAIATGWDCPRSHILVRFRETESTIFDIQTIGRILRTVERKHYGNDLIDTAYIYTEYDDLEYKLDVDEDMQDKILKEENKATLKDDFKENINIKLPMYKLNRSYNYGVDSKKLILEIAETFKRNLNNYKIDESALVKKIPIAKGRTINIEKEDKFLNKSFIEVPKNKFDIEYEYKKAISKIYLKHNLAKALIDIMQLHEDYGTDDMFTQKLYLSNKEQINNLIISVILKYEKRNKDVVRNLKEFKPVENQYYKDIDEACKNYAYDKMPKLDVKNTNSSSEEKLGEWLKNNKNIMWWFKNGVHGDNFSLVYSFRKNNGEVFNALYYPDFFIIDTERNLYIVDVKAPAGSEDYPYVKEKYESGKEFEKNIKGKDVGNIKTITLSIVKFIEEEPFICIADKYNENLSDTKSWIKLNEII